MPEWEVFDFRKFLKMSTLYIKNEQDFGVLLEQLIQLLFDHLSHAEVLALYLQS